MAELEIEADVVIIGYGAAGAAAAITAADNGCSAVVLEKQPEAEHTPNTMMSGGVVMGVADVDAATRYLVQCAGGMIPHAVCRAWAERAADLMPWLAENCPDLDFKQVAGAEHPEFDGAWAVGAFQRDGVLPPDDDSDGSLAAAGFATALQSSLEGRTGKALFASLAKAVRGRDEVRVEWGTPAERLVTDGAGRVVGVRASRTGDAITVWAHRGVVLASGGYEFDEEMRLNFLKAAPIHFYGNPANTGDGVRMAQAVGADLWHMNQMVGRAIGHFEDADGTPRNFVVRIDPPGYAILDRNGRRYANELEQARMSHAFYYHMLVFDASRREHPRIPSFWIFDESRRKAGPLVSTASGAVGVGLSTWSEDNSAEIEKGWIFCGDTVEEAAARAGIEHPRQAARTIAEYNQICASKDDPLGRSPESLQAIDQGPFYCVALYPGGSNTCGGPRRDETGRVLDPFGQPIPGLYSAGELGGAIGLLYPGNGANLSEALCFGQIAADSIAAER